MIILSRRLCAKAVKESPGKLLRWTPADREYLLRGLGRIRPSRRMLEAKNRFQIYDEIDTQQLAKVIGNCLAREPGEIVVIETVRQEGARRPGSLRPVSLSQSNPSSLNRAVRAAAMVSQMERLFPLVLRFTGPPVDKESRSSDDIWVSMAAEPLPEEGVSVKDLHVAAKSSVSALAVAITNIVHDGDTAKLIGIGPENAFKMARAIAIAANHCTNPSIGPVGDLLCQANTVVLDPTTNAAPSQRGGKPFWGLQLLVRIRLKKRRKKVPLYPVLPYRRLRPSSLHHYPEVSKITGERINWYSKDPQSGYEGAKMFGPHTIELDGMPMGRTPEYMQERLRRFFSKFGVVKICRAVPHELDPYQCQGKAYVTFRDRRSVFRALKAPLKFPASLHDKFVRMRDLDTDKRNDPLYLVKSEHNNRELVSVARQLHRVLLSDGPRPLSTVWQGVTEQEFKTERLRTANHCVMQRFGSWKDFLESEGMNHIVHCDGRTVWAKPMTPVRLEKQLLQLSIELSKKLKAECSVRWRQGREHIPLPEHTRFLMRKWDHHEKLAWCLQTMSHNHFYQRVYDPKLIAKWRIKRERNMVRNKAREEKRLESQRMAALEAA
ncbi:hypothetical protein FOZ61_007949 [Perkinsus olseni]|uniref:RRM domain-containing protein n=1 Tax=Perkinsus olseni TaxID=32597 RepID=A0A7J6M936_PEROL|nr:hypothetical protein FOZ61_007949 [Perkinsus olseni]